MDRADQSQPATGRFQSILKRLRFRRSRHALVGALLLAVLIGVCGCRTLGFYTQAIKGQYDIVARQKSVKKILDDPATSGALREKLLLLEKLCSFAKTNLQLPVNGHYRKYADLGRPFAVWNVEAAPEFSLESRTWWYPIVGSLGYRGYFSKSGATNYAAWLQRKGYDVYVDGVPAYSTLGWFKDPALNTFVFDPEADLAETIFHELGHQRVFASGDTEFNEAFATCVGQEGTRRWLHSNGDGPGYERYIAQLKRTDEFTRLIKATRLELAAIFGDERTETGKVRAGSAKREVPPEELRRQKTEALERMQQKYAQLKAVWAGANDYDGWFSRPINNAKLNSVATYYDLVPAFDRLLAEGGGDLERFYQAAERLARLPKKERHRKLHATSSGMSQATGEVGRPHTRS